MGIIKKQTIIGTFYTYLGAALGVFTNLVLLAWFFTPEQIGLVNILVAYSLLFAQFANLGFDNVTIRLFPFFRDEKSKHHHFFALMFKVILFGAAISLVIFLVVFQFILKKTEGDLFSKFGLYVLPLILFTLSFNSLDAYSRVLYKSVRGTFLKEVLQRVFVIVFIGFYLFFNFSFDLFVLFYVIALSLPTIILFILIYNEGNVSYKIDKSHLQPELKKEIFMVSAYGLITVFGSTIVSNIDKIMIQQYLDLHQIGLYSIAFFYGVIITMPSRALTKISSAVVAESWKINDIKTINVIYYKSCLNQMIFSLMLFLLIWLNIDSLLKLLPEKYSNIHWVVFWIGLGSFIDMATGINNTVIATSPKYKLQSLFMLIFIAIIITTNVIFIPLYGISGAAFASAFSLFLFNFIRWAFLWKQYKMQPFNYKFLIVLFVGFFIYAFSFIMPTIKPFYIDLIIRSILISTFYISLIWVLNISEDINERLKMYLYKIKGIIK